MIRLLEVLKQRIEKARAAPMLGARDALEGVIIAQSELNSEIVRELQGMNARLAALEGREDG